MPILEVEHISKSFNKTPVLKDVGFNLEKGQAVSIIGSSGSGKTTLLRCLNFLEHPDNGIIRVNGETLFDASVPATTQESVIRKKRLHFGLVFQNFNLFPQYTALENVMLAKKLLAAEQPDFKERKREILTAIEVQAKVLLTQMGLDNRMDNYPHQLSGGQCQRVAIARALALQPDILCFDEPTSALDPIGRKEILDILLSSKKQTTVLFSTHILSDVERICTDVAFLNNGKIAMQGAVADLKNVCSSHEFIVETIKADDAEYLSSVFTDAQLTAKDTLLFLGEQFKMFEVLEFITEHKILISKIERVEPSLESLFMEVVSK